MLTISPDSTATSDINSIPSPRKKHSSQLNNKPTSTPHPPPENVHLIQLDRPGSSHSSSLPLLDPQLNNPNIPLHTLLPASLQQKNLPPNRPPRRRSNVLRPNSPSPHKTRARKPPQNPLSKHRRRRRARRNAQKELQKSALELGLRSESDVFIVDDLARFPDGMDKNWDVGDVASLLASAFAPDMAASQKAKASGKKSAGSEKAPTATIDVILTFDQHGISNHPNHRSLYHGAVNFLRTLMKDKAGFTCPVTLYTLTTTSIFRKYVGILDAPLSMLLGAWSNLLASMSGSKAKDTAASGVGPVRLLFVSSIGDWIVAQSAMVKCHQSQMVWFRWGWITIGRYMTVNDLKRERV
ncbi:hypothetical protein N7444_004325 [Penicillium canescens]|nr:hypothetical protein N7444_004325 [Penicillium canescens]